MLGLLAIAVLYMGIHPKPFTDVMDASVANFLQHVSATKLK
jgi:NADH-quinone oxidoreductase subunit M